MSRVVVVGAGVVGLSCALRLLERGHRVDVVARELPLETTSAVAAAIWFPYRAFPLDRVAGWAAASYAEFEQIAKSEPESGVSMVEGTQVHREPTADPWWVAAVPALTRVDPGRPRYVDAWSFTTPLVEMPVYLPWLAGRVDELGGTITRLALNALPSGPDVVVNASGLGARLVAHDASVQPVRGQVVHVEQVGLGRWWLDEQGPTYVVPRSKDIVVGGTDDVGEWSRTPDPHTAAQLLDRAAQMVPQVRDARVLRHKVGLRPGRDEVRLEAEQRGSTRVVHCYGHGGAGVTLSWGCAEQVADLAEGSV